MGGRMQEESHGQFRDRGGWDFGEYSGNGGGWG